MSKINGIGIGVSYGNSSGSGSLLDSSTFFAPLKTSLILQRGTGGPTWSRATKAWGFNELGYLEELASGCAFFGGARLVRNTVRTTSEDFSNAAWNKINATVTGTNTIVCANATSAQYMYQTVLAGIVAGGTYGAGVRVKYVPGGVGFVQVAFHATGFGTAFVNVNLQTGAYSATGCSATITPVSGGGYDVYITAVAVASGTYDYVVIAFANSISSARLDWFVGDGVKSFELLRAWSVDVTNYDASYIPEYVSVGVEASPYFGAGIDGAKYFNTGWNGAPLTLQGFRREAAATNNLLGSRDFFIYWTPGVVAGTLFSDDFSSYADTAAMTAAGWTAAASTTQALSSAAILITNAGAAYGSSSKALTTEVGKTYLTTFAFTKTTANVTAYVANTAVAASAERLNTVSGTVTGGYSFIFTATATTTYLVFGLNSSTVGHEIKIDDVLVKESKVTVTKATGLDGIANTATTLTATAADAIILQPITLASAARCASAYVKRRTGTGTISFTQDGTNWTDITSQINSSTWSRVQITSTLANPSVGFKISTSGDAIDVDCVQNEAGAVATSPIVTTTAVITRNADSLTYQTAGNWSDTAGTVYADVEPYTFVGTAVGFGANGLTAATTNSGVKGYDGTNTANGPVGSPGTQEKIAISWGGGSMTAASSGAVGASSSYGGAFGLTNITIGTNGYVGYIGPVAIYNYQMTDAEQQAITS